MVLHSGQGLSPSGRSFLFNVMSTQTDQPQSPEFVKGYKELFTALNGAFPVRTLRSMVADKTIKPIRRAKHAVFHLPTVKKQLVALAEGRRAP